MTGDLLGTSNVGNNLESLAGLRHALQAKHFDRRRGAGFGDGLPAVIEHRAYLAKDLTDDEWIADTQGALLNQRSRHRATAAIEFGFQHYSRSQPSGAGAQIQDVGSEQNSFEQVLEVLAFLRRDFNHLSLATPGHGVESLL